MTLRLGDYLNTKVAYHHNALYRVECLGFGIMAAEARFIHIP